MDMHIDLITTIVLQLYTLDTVHHAAFMNPESN